MDDECENPYLCKPAYAHASNPEGCVEIPCEMQDIETDTEIVEPDP